MWVRTQDREKLIECINIQYVARERYTESYLKLEEDVKNNYVNYINPKTDKQMQRSEIYEYLAERVEKYTEHSIKNYNINDNSDTFGKYPTKERCLEVLDEIEAYINGWGIRVNGNALQVFQMPKE